MPGKRRKTAARPRKGERRARADTPAAARQPNSPYPTPGGRKRRRDERANAHQGADPTDLLVESLMMTGIAEKLLARVLALAQESGLRTKRKEGARKKGRCGPGAPLMA
jgi:hypothetical protein